MRQHWPQTEIFHTKEALHRTATFIKKGNFTPAFRFLPMKRAPHEDTGTSNNPKVKMGPPKWEESIFEAKYFNARKFEIQCLIYVF